MVKSASLKQTNIRPFLKWAGGKFRLLNKITTILPKGTRLIEPFSGSAAIFLNTEYQRYWLNDLNIDLINLYKQVKKHKTDFIDYAKTFFLPKTNSKKYYHKSREQFNCTQDILEKSALFLYLNRHSYNGLCRYNQQGKFNVPFGYYKKPYFPEQQLQSFVEKSKIAKFTHQDFENVMQKAKAGDIIYCDPPYTPLSETANFTQYSHKNFSEQQQQRLAELALELSKKNVPVIISNHNTPFTRKLYQKAKLKKFTVPRLISCKVNQRTPANELLAIYE